MFYEKFSHTFFLPKNLGRQLPLNSSALRFEVRTCNQQKGGQGALPRVLKNLCYLVNVNNIYIIFLFKNFHIFFPKIWRDQLPLLPLNSSALDLGSSLCTHFMGGGWLEDSFFLKKFSNLRQQLKLNPRFLY